MNNNAMPITELYRQIGRMFRAHGADRVILLNARNDVFGGQMSLEIAVDGMFEPIDLQSRCREQWPWIEIKIIDLNESGERELQEAIEDGIVL